MPPTPPDGYEQLTLTGFAARIGPIFYRIHPVTATAPGETRMWFCPQACHLNEAGVLDGAVMAILAQSALKTHALAITGAADGELLSFACDFTGAGEGGEPVCVRARLTRATRSILFLGAVLFPGGGPETDDGAPLLTASALWRRGEIK